MALKAETQRKIKKTNKDVAAYGDQIVKHAKEVTATMKANVKTLKDKLAKAKSGFALKMKKTEAAGIARHVAAIKQIEDGLDEADKVNTKKFGDVFIKMGADRAHADQALASAVKQLNDGLAKHAALEDSRFQKTVKDLKKARKDTWTDVKEAHKFFTMGFALATSEMKNKNKIVAHQEVADLAKSTAADIKKTRSYMAKLRKQAAKDLTAATEGLYLKLNQDQVSQNAELAKLTTTLHTVKASTAAALAKAKADFDNKYQQIVDNEAANHKKYEAGLKKVTGVAHDWKVAD